MPSSPPNDPGSVTPDQDPGLNLKSASWDQVVNDFRQVCILRREGKFAEAQTVLDQRLPHSIAQWSREAHGDAPSKKSRLQEMFEFERKRLEDAWAMERALREQVKHEVLAELKASMTADLEKQARTWFDSWLKTHQPAHIESAPSPEPAAAQAAMMLRIVPQNAHTPETPSTIPVAWISSEPAPQASRREVEPPSVPPAFSTSAPQPNHEIAASVFAPVPPTAHHPDPLRSSQPRTAGPRPYRPGFDDIAGALDWILSEQEECATDQGQAYSDSSTARSQHATTSAMT